MRTNHTISMNCISKVTKMNDTCIWLMVMLLIPVMTSTVFSSKLVAGQNEKQFDNNAMSESSSVDLYYNMVLAEKEHEELENNIDKDEEKASLLSMTTFSGTLQCISCTGILPSIWHNDQIDEESYCFPDSDLTQSVCTEAVRCWKAKVREQDGLIRISRGCIGGKFGSSSDNGLHICMGAIPVINTKNKTMENDNSTPLQSYTIWKSSHTYSSLMGNQQSSMLPPSYTVECCAGRDRCNEGSFPSLPDISLMTDNDKSLFAAMTSWKWSLVLVVIVTSAVTIVSIITLFKDHNKGRKKKRLRHKRKWNSENGCEDSYNDKRKRRRQNVSLSSSFSSTTSINSSVSCCESKTGKKKCKKKPQSTALTMVDLLKGVVVTKDMLPDSEDMYSHPLSMAEGIITCSSVDEGFLPPPYQRQEENEFSSGSGFGMPVLVQRTLAKQIQLRQLVGKGRYGEVWRAIYWNGGHEHVAVKIFLSKDEPSWKRETEIYSTVLMRHDNILGFIGSDIMTSRNSYTTQLLLITHFHQHGSLYDFLQTNLESTCHMIEKKYRPPLTISQMLNVLYTVASGLCHLHTEIHGTQGKPAIAHRDIKSKNVLVKCAQTGSCCVADFGMAVTNKDKILPIQTTISAGTDCQNTRVGTKRYMAPEVLDDSIFTATVGLSSTIHDSSTYSYFDAYRRGDLYSYALIMWEVLSRTLIFNEGSKFLQQHQQMFDNEYNPYIYRAPYQDRDVGWDPGFEDMRRIVCSSDPIKSRPGIATEWLNNPITNCVVTTMRECWNSNPNARLPALRVKKTLVKLIDLHTTAETKIHTKDV